MSGNIVENIAGNIVKIGGFQKLTLLDYPGQVACIVFTAGCNFRCPFCQNAGLLAQDGGFSCREEEIFAYLRKRKGLLDGVVISGGEPLMQEGIIEFIGKIRDLGLSVKIDTNGSFPERLAYLLEEKLVDYAAVDIKNSRRHYGAASGLPDGDVTERVAESIALLKKYADEIPCEFRTTLVKGIHEKEDVEEIARHIGGDVPYYLQSYSDAGDILKPEGLSSFSKEELRTMLDAARRYSKGTELRNG